MDPVSALGIAAASLQFLDAGLKVLALCRETHADAESSTRRNRLLETCTKSSRELRDDLRTSSLSIPKTIVDAVNECIQTSDELLRVLEQVRGPNRPANTLKATFRALRKSGTIQRLEESLKSKQEVLERAISQDTWLKASMFDLKQSERFAALKTNVQYLINQQIQQQNLNTANVMTGLESLTAHIRARDEEARRIEERHKVLKSLFYTEIDERRSRIEDAAPGTLNWVFQSSQLRTLITDSGSESVDSDSQEEPYHSDPEPNYYVKWDSFSAWLKSDNSVYWISGKAGSGKSTLMAHILEDPRTRQGLEVWASGRNLHVLSFFFWRPGSALQKSITGLLRSLMFQMCKLCPNIIPALLLSLGLNADMLPRWTDKHLIKAIEAIARLASDSCFAIFIDGLDEFEGDLDKLISLVFAMDALENLKCCVSSRPEVQLLSQLAKVDQLHLHDLNWRDIRKFARSHLSQLCVSRRSRARMINRLVRRAEGVFLWATLVSESLVSGSKKGDDEKTLWKRLESTPQGIYDIFVEMVERVEGFHRDTLSFYLQCMRLKSWKCPTITSIAVLTASRLSEEIGTYADFVKQCQQTEIQIQAQSVGLLRVASRSDSHLEGLEDGRPPFFFIVANDQGHRYEQKLDTWPPVLEYEDREVVWLHRSVFDLFFDPQVSNRFSVTVSLQDAQLRLWEGSLRYLAYAPSYSRVTKFPMTMKRIRELCDSVYMADYQTGESGHQTLDKLHTLLSRFDASELSSAAEEACISCQENHHCLETFTFWSACANNRNFSYISARCEQLNAVGFTCPSITYILARSLQFNYHEGSPTLLPMLCDVLNILNNKIPDLESTSIYPTSRLILSIPNVLSAWSRGACSTLFRLPQSYDNFQSPRQDLLAFTLLAQAYWNWIGAVSKQVPLDPLSEQISWLFREMLRKLHMYCEPDLPFKKIHLEILAKTLEQLARHVKIVEDPDMKLVCYKFGKRDSHPWSFPGSTSYSSGFVVVELSFDLSREFCKFLFHPEGIWLDLNLKHRDYRLDHTQIPRLCKLLREEIETNESLTQEQKEFANRCVHEEEELAGHTESGQDQN